MPVRAQQTSHRSWLPFGAVERGVRNLELAQVIADWSTNWFAQGKAHLAGDPVRGGPADPRADLIWEAPDGLCLILAAGADNEIARLMYGEPEDGAQQTAADREALKSCSDASLADLRARLATAFRLGAEAPWRPETQPAPSMGYCWTWRVETKGVSLLRIAADEALITRWVRNSLKPAEARNGVVPLAQALADQDISVSALLGRSRLTTRDLAGLAAGDVLVLDRAFTEPIEIAVDNVPKSMSCVIAQREEQIDLVIV